MQQQQTEEEEYGMSSRSSMLGDENDSSNNNNNGSQYDIDYDIDVDSSKTSSDHGGLLASFKTASTTSTSSNKVFKCKQCLFQCVNKEDYWQHQRQVHIKPEKLLECSKCSFVTEYKHHLEYHLRNHLGSKPYKCTQCDYACVNLSMLRSHQKSHAKSLLYSCADCTYTTKYFHSLKTHVDKFGHSMATSPATTTAANTSNSLQYMVMMNGIKNNNNDALSTCSSTSSKSSDIKPATARSTGLANKKLKSAQNNETLDDLNSSGSSSSSSSASSLSASPNSSSHAINNTSNNSFVNAAATAAGIPPSALAALSALSQYNQQTAPTTSLSQQIYNSSFSSPTTSTSEQQLQMALAAAFATSDTKSSINLATELYLKQQQQELLLTANYLQPLLQQANLASSQQQQQHEHNIESSPELTCKQCKNLKFTSRKELKKHQRLVHFRSENEREEETPRKQSPSSSSTLIKPSLSHVNSENNSIPVLNKNESLIECTDCEIIFKSNTAYATHRQVHSQHESFINNKSSNSLRCMLCHFELPNMVEYFLHIQTAHHGAVSSPNSTILNGQLSVALQNILSNANNMFTNQYGDMMTKQLSNFI